MWPLIIIESYLFILFFVKEIQNSFISKKLLSDADSKFKEKEYKKITFLKFHI